MIPINAITQWRKNANWIYQSQIEQDLVLSRALVSLYQNDVIQQTLAFRGGTALNKLFVNEPARYSEDLDFFLIQDKPPVPLRLKIEINTTEAFSLFGYQQKSYAVDNQWFNGEATINTYCVEELMGTKLRALYQRAKGRDLYDLWLGISHFKMDCEKVLEAFQHYNQFNKINISRAEFEKNLLLKMKMQEFIKDATLVLANRVNWQPEVSAELVMKKLVEKLPGEPWKLKEKA